MLTRPQTLALHVFVKANSFREKSFSCLKVPKSIIKKTLPLSSVLIAYEQHYKPSSVFDDHLSVPYVTIWLVCLCLPYKRKASVKPRPTLKHDGPPYRFKFGLTSSGVYMCPVCYHPGGGLLHHPSTLTRMFTIQAVHFCCTILRVASTGRYPALCPMKLGLSSPKAFRQLIGAIICATHSLLF